VREHNAHGDVRKFRLSDQPGFYYTPVWSPDSRKIAFTDKRLHVGYVELESGKVTLVDRDRYDGPRRIRHVAWSPDSMWLAYTKQMPSTLRAVFFYSLATGKSHQITDGLSDATVPLFDKDGKYLYFLASTDTGLNVGWRDMSAFFRTITNSVYLVVLDKNLPSPLAPESDEEKASAGETAKSEPARQTAPQEIRIDLEDIDQRVLALPVPARPYTALRAGKAGTLFLMEAPVQTGPPPAPPAEPPGNTVHRFDLKTRKLEKAFEGVREFAVSANGERALYRQGARWLIGAAMQPPKPNEGVLKMDTLEARVDPVAEWRQIYNEGWRIMRDFFYDPNLHGVNLSALVKRYEPYLAAVSSRSDLTYLLQDMMGEFTCSHLNVAGVASPEVRRVRGGLLGADYSIENARYRFARVYSGENWNPDLRAPLTEPGVNVNAGEYLLAVNGRELRASDNLFSFFEGLADKQVALRVGPDPNGAGARDLIVVPVAGENALRYRAWIEDNRRKVDQLSGGRLAYVHLPDTALGGYTNFNRYYFAQTGKQGAVVDERFNGGGAQPDYIVDYMKRPLLHFRTTRDGEDITGPLAGIFGPKAMLINEYAGSGGDTLPWYFRTAGVGPLIGKRTWGGLVGGLGGWPILVDGGVVTPPSVGFWDPKAGKWVAENTGIAPDMEVEFDPKAWREGRDPQLEKAVEFLLEQLRRNPPPQYKRPAFPSYRVGA
jgi:tricorn protease